MGRGEGLSGATVCALGRLTSENRSRFTFNFPFPFPTPSTLQETEPTRGDLERRED